MCATVRSFGEQVVQSVRPFVTSNFQFQNLNLHHRKWWRTKHNGIQCKPELH